MEREKRKEEPQLPHTLTIQDRARMAVSGVLDVATFDEAQVVLRTSMGRLTVRGHGLHVDQLSLDSGELRLSGTVETLEYDSGATASGGVLSRLLR